MDFFNSKKFMVLIGLVLFLTAISGCAKQNLKPKQPTTMETVGNMKAIVSVLGCMFAPDSEECKSLKGVNKESEEDKEWNELDGDTK